MQLKEVELKKKKTNKPSSQTRKAPPLTPSPPSKVHERIEKLEKELQVDNEEDFFFCLKHILTNCIVSKLIISKKSVKFTKFDGLQNTKMDVRKFQEEVMEYVHDRDMFAKLFSSSLKDDALKWYCSLPKKSIDKYKDLILKFLRKFKYNITKKVQFKDLCKVKQLPN